MNKPFNAALIKPISQSAEFGESGNRRSGRAMLVDGIVRQIALYKDPTKEGSRWFTIGKSEVALALKLGNKPIKILGEERKVAVPLDAFEAAMLHYKAETEAGKLDAAIKEVETALDARREKASATRAKNAATKAS
jgi:hypothetical protein